MDSIEQIDNAIAALQAQEELLGKDVVATAVAPLLEKRAALIADEHAEQRRMVTVLFADLVGFTAMSAGLDAEDVRNVLSRYFAAWQHTIADHGGVVEKYIGDAVMAVFGLHGVEEDDAERAIDAALAMRTALDELNIELRREHGVELALRTGVDTGEVVVGGLGDRQGQDWVVVGDIVNRASRVQSAAPTNGILITHDTYRLVRGVFAVEQVEPLTLKGVRGTVDAYLVNTRRAREFRMQTRGVEGIETRTVGRELELQQLRGLLADIMTDPRPTLVTVVGDAGVGKSRVLDDFDNWLELIPDRVKFFKGRALPATRNQPNALVRDVMTFRFEIHDNDPPDMVAAKLMAGLGEAFGTDATLAGKAALVARWLGLAVGDEQDLDRQQLRDRAVGLLGEYFAALATGVPVVVLLEDLHWADDGTLELLTLLRWLPPAPILIVATTRPTLFERRPDWEQELPEHVRITLAPLSQQHSAQLLRDILQRAGSVPPQLVEQVVQTAEGNPFFIEELVKWFVEQGVIDVRGPRWEISVERLTQTSVPPTLRGVLQARLDGLRTDERTTLQRASVIGRAFWDHAVGSLTVPEHVPADALDHLIGREVVFRREPSVFDGMREFVFKHALLRDVAYESVLRAQRRDYHARAASWLQQVTALQERTAEYAATIAEHLELAGQTEAAARWYLRAGQQAARVHAHPEAVRALDHALELAPPHDHVLRFDILLAREAVHDRVGDREGQRADQNALLSVSGIDDHRRVQLLIRQARLRFFESRFEEVVQFAGEAAELAAASGLREDEVDGLTWQGKALTWIGRHDEAGTALANALDRARAVGVARLEGEVLRYQAILANNTGRLEDAVALLSQAGDAQRQVGDVDAEASARAQLGATLYNLGRYDEARAAIEQALEVFKGTGFRYGINVAEANLAIVDIAQFRLARAARLLERAVEASTAAEDREGKAIALGSLGDVYLHVGDWESARRYLEQSLAVATEVSHDPVIADSASVLAFVLAESTGDTSAAALADDAVARARAVAPLQEQRAVLARAYARATLGALDGALEDFLAVCQVPAGPDNVAREGRAGLALTTLHSGRPDEALELVEPLLTRLGVDDLAGMLCPGRMLHACIEILDAVDDVRTNDVAARAAEALQKLADRIDDAQMRACFETSMHSNRAILQRGGAGRSPDARP